jgi:Cysteine-rich CWC
MVEENLSNDEKLCPLCGSMNKCGAKNGDCWCFHKNVPIKLRERVPIELKGKACICQKCVDDYLQEFKQE